VIWNRLSGRLSITSLTLRVRPAVLNSNSPIRTGRYFIRRVTGRRRRLGIGLRRRNRRVRVLRWIEPGIGEAAAQHRHLAVVDLVGSERAAARRSLPIEPALEIPHHAVQETPVQARCRQFTNRVGGRAGWIFQLDLHRLVHLAGVRELGTCAARKLIARQ